jgi:hypothetical protein
MADQNNDHPAPTPQPATVDAQTTPTDEKGEAKEDVVEVRSLVDLPLARVKRIMKSDADVKLISQEAVVLVTKAAVC